MKFGKEYVSQMIPEWQQAYLDYACLKTILKEIQNLRKRAEEQGILKRKLSVRHNFSGLTKRHSHTISSLEPESQYIIMDATTGDDGFEKYETTILKVAEVGRQSEVVFFKTLDLEFDKVNHFYWYKMEQLVKETVALNKQMDALIAFRIKVDQPSSSWSYTETVSVDMNALDSKDQSKFPEIQSESNGADSKKESVQEVLSVLDRIRLNTTQETPLSTVRNVLKLSNQEELKFTKENLKKTEEALKNVFIQFYRKLSHLENYSFSNTLAISKIMKKYDKIASRNAAKPYMEMVDTLQENKRFATTQSVTNQLHFHKL